MTDTPAWIKVMAFTGLGMVAAPVLALIAWAGWRMFNYSPWLAIVAFSFFGGVVLFLAAMECDKERADRASFRHRYGRDE